MSPMFVGTDEATLLRRGFLGGCGTGLVMGGGREDQARGGEGGEKGWEVYGGVKRGCELER